MQFSQIKEEPTFKSHSEILNKVRQNYAPFISKCNRFQPIKRRKEQEPQPQILDKLVEKGTIKNASRIKDKDRKSEREHSVQYIFKSNQGRFEYISGQNTPSPGDYNLASDIKIKSRSNSKSRCKNQHSPGARVSTLPSIPDKRNKFGINLESNNYLEKGQQLINKEKQLMKVYREALIEPQDRLKQSKSTQNYFQRQLQKKLHTHVINQSLRLKENKTEESKAQTQGKLKVNHLYEYHPVRKVQRLVPIKFDHPIQKKKKQTKFQFFNSSQKRFKDNGSHHLIQKKKSVLQYLNNMSSDKTDKVDNK